MTEPRLPLGKHCRKCGKWKLYEGFSRKPVVKDGRDSRCKECRNAYNREWREHNPDYVAPSDSAEYHRQWSAENPEKVKAKSRRYYEQHREKELARSRQFYKENIDYYRQWYIENRERSRELAKRWREENRDKRRETARAWRQKNPDKVRERERKRRSRKLRAEGSYTNEEFAALCKKYGNKCLCCGACKPLHADHVVPLSKGGNDFIDNIQPLCRVCNSSKHDKIIDYR